MATLNTDDPLPEANDAPLTGPLLAEGSPFDGIPITTDDADDILVA